MFGFNRKSQAPMAERIVQDVPLAVRMIDDVPCAIKVTQESSDNSNNSTSTWDKTINAIINMFGGK